LFYSNVLCWNYPLIP